MQTGAQSTMLSWQPGTPFVYSVEQGGLKGNDHLPPQSRYGRARDYRGEASRSRSYLRSALLARREMARLSARETSRSSSRIWQPGAKRSWARSLERGEYAHIPRLERRFRYGVDGHGGRCRRQRNHLPIRYRGIRPTAFIRRRRKSEILPRAADCWRWLQTSAAAIWRAPADTPGAEPDVIDAANGNTWSPSFAPDGTLAFLSNRSGTNAIWLMKPGTAPSLLFDAGISAIERVRFSPDGAKLAVAVETAQGITIRIMTQAGANLSSFEMPSLGLGLPSWTPDSNAVLVFDRRSRRTVAVPIDDTARRIPFAPPHWVGIAVRKDGTFATRADKPGIWRIDGRITQINDAYPAFYLPPLAFRGGDVLVPQYDPGGTPRILAQPLSGWPGPADRLCAGRGRSRTGSDPTSPSIRRAAKLSILRLFRATPISIS